MKKILFTLCASATLASTQAVAADYQVKNAGTTADTAVALESKPDYRLLWYAAAADQKYVKTTENNTFEYTNTFVSGSAKNKNMIVVMEDNSTMKLTAAEAMANNGGGSGAWLYSEFQLASDATAATVELSNTKNDITYINLSYAPASGAKAFGATDIRGLNLGEGVTIKSASNLEIKDNYGVNAGDATLTLNGNIIAGTDASKNVTILDVATTQGADSTISANNIILKNTEATTPLSSTYAGTLNAETVDVINNNVSLATVKSDTIKLENSTATFSNVSSFTADTTPMIRLNGGTSTISTTSENVLANVKIAEFSDDDGTIKNSVLNIGNSMSVLAINTEHSVLNVDSGITLKVGDGTAQNAFNVQDGTIKGTLEVNTFGSTGHGSPNYFGNLTVDGGTLRATNTDITTYNLAPNSGAVITVKNGATIDAGKGYLGMTGGTYDVDATSRLVTNKIAFYGSNGTLKLSSTNNLSSAATVFVKDATSPVQIILTKTMTDGVVDVYNFGRIELLRNSNLDIHLNGAAVEFKGITPYKTDATATSDIVFYDFANGLVKLNLDGDTTTLSENGDLIFTIEGATVTYDVTISAYVGSDKTSQYLTTGWKIDENGYLFNSQLVVPEPAEWAAIFGAIALGLAIYRRRK